MELCYWVVKKIVLGIVISVCATYTVFAQAPMASFIDTASRPKVFAEGSVSSPYSEWATSFSPDGNTVYFSRGAVYWTICCAKLENGKWRKPEVVSFSGKYNDTDPFISPDGKKLFFVSNRPLDPKAEKPQKNYHLWYANKTADGWGEPQHIDNPVNLAGSSNYAPSVSSSGTLFFCSRGRDGNKGMASYAAKWMGDRYDKPRLLALNGTEDTQDPFTAPDESYVIFLSGNDIFYAPKTAAGYGPAQTLGPQVNDGAGNSSPYISRDGKTLYYSSNRIRGFYKRDYKAKPLTYDQLEAENKSLFNSEGNILMIPVNLPAFK